MHELGIMTGVVEAVEIAAREAGATKILRVDLSVGVLSEVVGDSLQFAFEALTMGTPSEGASLVIKIVETKSECLDCKAVFEHDRFHRICPECGSLNTNLIAGRELQIDSIEVDIPDAGDLSSAKD